MAGAAEAVRTAVRDRVISDGIAEIEGCYEEGDPRRAGAIEGFELCRSLLTREEFERVLQARQRREQTMALRDRSDENTDSYWRHRYVTLQVEWVLGCLDTLDALTGGRACHVSARQAMKVSEVIGALAQEAEAAPAPLSHDEKREASPR